MRKKLPKPVAKRLRGRPQKVRTDSAATTLSLDLPVAPRPNKASAAAAPSTIILRHLTPAKVSEVYESYWRFAAERQNVFFRRARGEARPWTGNAVLTTYKFTNAYRASDRASQYLIRNVIYRADLPRSPAFSLCLPSRSPCRPTPSNRQRVTAQKCSPPPTKR